MLAIIDAEKLGIPVLELPKAAGAEEGCARCQAFSPAPGLDGKLAVDPEIHLPSPGMDVDVAYYYNNAFLFNGPYGYGRTLSVNLLAQASGSPMVVTLVRATAAR